MPASSRTYVCGEQVVQALYLSFLFSSVLNSLILNILGPQSQEGPDLAFCLGTSMPPSRLAFG